MKNQFVKRMFSAIAVLLFVLQNSSVNAQTEQSEVRVSVCVGEERLENLLTDSQKDSVTHLTITGTMAEEDYAFIRRNRLKRIEELNFRDADIDTIPPHAFDMNWWDFNMDLTIVLPKSLKYLSDYSLCILLNRNKCTYVFTGDYPNVGNNVYNSGKEDYEYTIRIFVPSEDNPFLKKEDQFLYSYDGSKLYLADGFSEEIAYGTKIINGRAFENMFVHYSTLVIPETVDSIGDRAFAGLKIGSVTSNGFYCWGYITCLATNPPKLGKDVFYISYPWFNMFEDYGMVLYVPDGSEDLYRAAEGWKDFWKIYPQSEFHGGESGVKDIDSDKGLSVKERCDGYVLKSSHFINKVTGYGVGGKMLFDSETDVDIVNIPKESLVSPYTILRVCYDDGTCETVKLKP